jgi:hypothetical protein
MVGDKLLLRDFGPYGIIFMVGVFYNRYHGNAVEEFLVYGIIFAITHVYYIDIPVILDG